MEWLAIGPVANWTRAIEVGMWGMTERYSFAWKRVEVGDLLFFYVTKPVKGVVGYAAITEKRRDERLMWPLEVEGGKALWPLRVRFETSLVLPREEWETGRVRLTSEHVVLQKGFQPLREDVRQFVVERLTEAKEG